MDLSLLKTKCLSAILEPDVMVGRRLWLWAGGGMVSYLLAGVGSDFGFGLCRGLGCSLSCSLVFSCCCSCWRCSGPFFCAVSACYDASSPPPSIFAVLSLPFSLASWLGATPFMIIASLAVIPAPNIFTFSWRVSNVCSLSCIHVIIPSHCASSQAVSESSKFARCATFRTICVSFCVRCRIALWLWHPQWLGALEASWALLGIFPFTLHSSGSPAVAVAGMECVIEAMHAMPFAAPISSAPSISLSPARLRMPMPSNAPSVASVPDEVVVSRTCPCTRFVVHVPKLLGWFIAAW